MLEDSARWLTDQVQGRVRIKVDPFADRTELVRRGLVINHDAAPEGVRARRLLLSLCLKEAAVIGGTFYGSWRVVVARCIGHAD